MNKIKEQIRDIACRYDLQIIYAFGSRGREAMDLAEGRIGRFSSTPSDLDIGVKPGRALTVQEKVDITILFEDLFEVENVDLIVLPEAPVSLAFEIVTGEILYMDDPIREAEYQLYIMRLTEDLLPYERMKQEMILGK
jgi:hypothetical protein